MQMNLPPPHHHQSQLNAIQLYGPTPSGKDGINNKLENQLRMLACLLIAESGRTLSLPQTTIATAQALLHRFYYVATLKKHSIKDIALACLFLASKAEETPKSIRSILVTFHTVYLTFQGVPTIEPLEPGSVQFSDWEHKLLRSEMYILKNLGFHINVDHPYFWLAQYVKALEIVQHTELIQTAWNHCNDSYLYPIHIFYPPHAIAVSAIWLAAQSAIQLPDNWYLIFDVSFDTITSIVAQLKSVPPNQLLFRPDLPMTIDELSTHKWENGNMDEMLTATSVLVARSEFVKQWEASRVAKQVLVEESSKQGTQVDKLSTGPSSAVGMDAFQAALAQAKARAANAKRGGLPHRPATDQPIHVSQSHPSSRQPSSVNYNHGSRDRRQLSPRRNRTNDPYPRPSDASSRSSSNYRRR